MKQYLFALCFGIATLLGACGTTTTGESAGTTGGIPGSEMSE